MSEDSKIVIDYSDIQRVIGEKPAPCATSPIENWNSPNKEPTSVMNDYSVSPFAKSKFSLSIFIMIGTVVTITIVVVIFCVAFLVKTVNKQGKLGTGNKTAAYSYSSQAASVGAQNESVFFSNDDSKFESEKTMNPAVSKFRRDVFATESGIEKNFDYKYLLWSADENNVQNVVDKYRKASYAVSEWTKKLAEINVNSTDYQDVPGEIKTNFERYRTSATTLNDAFTSYIIDDETVKCWTAYISMTGNVEVPENNIGIVTFTAAVIRNEYNNQIRSVSKCCSSCASERNAFEKSCSL